MKCAWLFAVGSIAMGAASLGAGGFDDGGGWPLSGGSSSKASTPATAPARAEPYFVSGRVVDPRGEPIAGAKLHIDNAMFYNSGVTVSTDVDGRYRIKLPEGVYTVTGKVVKEFNGRKYELALHPTTSTDGFAAADGAIRDFEWKLAGTRYDDLGHYGWTVYLWRDPNCPVYDTQSMELTLEPVGPLIDGSEGKTILRKVNPKKFDALHDVPIGRYKITAKYRPKDGPEQAMVVRQMDLDDETTYADSCEADFLPQSGPEPRAIRVAANLKG